MAVALLWTAPATASALFEPIDNPYTSAAGVHSCEEVSASQYLDNSALQCIECPAGQTASASGLSCRCVSGILVQDGDAYACSPCAQGTARTADGTACLPCGTTTTGLQDGECGCPAGHGLLDTDGSGQLLSEKQCAACGDSAHLSSAGVCIACPADQVANGAGDGCECAEGYRSFAHAEGLWQSGLGGGDASCIMEEAYNGINGAARDTTSSYQVRFGNLLGGEAALSVTSKAFRQLLLTAGAECLRAVDSSTGTSDSEPHDQPREDGNAACNALANLCVTQLYDPDSEACDLFSSLRDRSVNNDYDYDEWKKRLPWLGYDARDQGFIRSEGELPSFEVDLSGDSSTLSYVVARHSLNGTFLGLEPFVEQLQLCSSVDADRKGFLTVGDSMKISCDLDVQRLLSTAEEPVFYDLFLQVGAGSGRDELYPVPVLLIRPDHDYAGGMWEASTSILSFELDDILVRRFFAVDTFSMREGAGSDLQAIRYVRDATLTVTLTPSDPSRIQAPLLTLEYAEVALSLQDDGSLAATAELPATFRAQYTSDLSRGDVTYVFTFALIFWAIASLGPLYMQMRRNKGQVVDLTYLVGVLATVSHAFSNVFFLFLFGCCGWVLLLYKGQNEIYFLMPISEGPYLSHFADRFRDILVAALFAKCLHIVDLVWRQTRLDLFFIDWEQPRGRDAERGGDENGDDPSHGVSTWRTIFVANEWVQLQGARAVSLELSLVALLFLLRGLDVEDFTRLTPHGRGEPGVPYDVFLRFAVSTFLLLTIALAQWLVRCAIWNRFVQDRVWQFVDLLSVTNISVLLLQEQTYGYYLHGRSVHEHADTDMLQVNRQLKREEEGLCAQRGLLKDSDVQSFEIFVSREVRDMYDRALRGAGRIAAARASRAQRDRRRRGFQSSPEDLLVRQRETNDFLTSFINGSLERMTLKVRRKQYWERLINLPPETNPLSKESIFLEDPGGSFRALLFAGREFDLVVLHALTYGLVDLVYTNTFTAVFVTYIVDQALRITRHQLALRNIARKTLLDPRFLL